MAELLIVVAIILIIAAIAVPNIAQTVANYRLNASGQSVASLLQQARLTAVKTNQPYYARFDTTKTPNIVFFNPDPAVTTFSSGLPSVAVDGNTVFQTAALPDHSQLDAYLGASVSIQAGAGAIGFNQRGLPCLSSTNTINTPCDQNAPPPGGGARAFIWFMQYQSSGWEAVTVTPGGRIKSWRLSSLDPSSTACGYPACWQ